MTSIDDFGTLTASLRSVGNEKCPDCTGTFGSCCDWHRCRAIRANGKRCKVRVPAGMEDYCPSHGCNHYISHRPVAMRCSAPVVWVDKGRSRTLLCPVHAEERYPGRPTRSPAFTYPEVLPAEQLCRGASDGRPCRVLPVKSYDYCRKHADEPQRAAMERDRDVRAARADAAAARRAEREQQHRDNVAAWLGVPVERSAVQEYLVGIVAEDDWGEPRRSPQILAARLRPLAMALDGVPDDRMALHQESGPNGICIIVDMRDTPRTGTPMGLRPADLWPGDEWPQDGYYMFDPEFIWFDILARDPAEIVAALRVPVPPTARPAA